eukprot:m.465918 g.465918  ORF g.465918 m.465918 type:complete len:717 (+) comp24697_c0_seq1:164-2314(+)
MTDPTDLKRRVKEAEETDVLDLSSCHMTVYPHSTISQLSDCLGDVVELNLSSNKLTGIPDEINSFAMLQILNCQHNQICAIQDLSQGFSELTNLHLNGNNLTSIPETVSQLNELRVLDVSFNDLQTLPNRIGDLENLTILNASHNRIQHIPPSIGNLGELVVMNLAFNELTKLPRDIAKLQSLRTLTLSENKLIELPIALRQLKSTLEDCDVEGNVTLKEPPYDRCSMGIEYMFQWLFEKAKLRHMEQIGDPGTRDRVASWNSVKSLYLETPDIPPYESHMTPVEEDEVVEPGDQKLVESIKIVSNKLAQLDTTAADPQELSSPEFSAGPQTPHRESDAPSTFGLEAQLTRENSLVVVPAVSAHEESQSSQVRKYFSNQSPPFLTRVVDDTDRSIEDASCESSIVQSESPGSTRIDHSASGTVRRLVLSDAGHKNQESVHSVLSRPKLKQTDCVLDVDDSSHIKPNEKSVITPTNNLDPSLLDFTVSSRRKHEQFIDLSALLESMGEGATTEYPHRRRRMRTRLSRHPARNRGTDPNLDSLIRKHTLRCDLNSKSSRNSEAVKKQPITPALSDLLETNVTNEPILGTTDPISHRRAQISTSREGKFHSLNRCQFTDIVSRRSTQERKVYSVPVLGDLLERSQPRSKTSDSLNHQTSLTIDRGFSADPNSRPTSSHLHKPSYHEPLQHVRTRLVRRVTTVTYTRHEGSHDTVWRCQP